MGMRHKVQSIVTTALLAGGALAVTAAPASAGPPGCIYTRVENVRSVTVFNNCPQGAGYYLRVIWNNASDSSCFWLGSGQSRWVHEGHSPFTSYGRTVLC
jgi:hypothetical protein